MDYFSGQDSDSSPSTKPKIFKQRKTNLPSSKKYKPPEDKGGGLSSSTQMNTSAHIMHICHQLGPMRMALSHLTIAELKLIFLMKLRLRFCQSWRMVKTKESSRMLSSRSWTPQLKAQLVFMRLLKSLSLMNQADHLQLRINHRELIRLCTTSH